MTKGVKIGYRIESCQAWVTVIFMSVNQKTARILLASGQSSIEPKGYFDLWYPKA